MKKPLLTITNQHSRKQLATNHVLKPINFSKIVIFSDKTTLQLFPNQKVYVRRSPETGLEEKYLSKTTKVERKKLFIWGFITYDGKKSLAKIVRNVNSIY